MRGKRPMYKLLATDNTGTQRERESGIEWRTWWWTTGSSFARPLHREHKYFRSGKPPVVADLHHDGVG
jgi:hypothetical protein